MTWRIIFTFLYVDPFLFMIYFACDVSFNFSYEQFVREDSLLAHRLILMLRSVESIEESIFFLAGFS